MTRTALGVAACALLLGLSPRTAAAETCAYPDFDAFLTKFSADPGFQQQATADPLPLSWVDMTAEPEPAKVSRDMPMASCNGR